MNNDTHLTGLCGDSVKQCMLLYDTVDVMTAPGTVYHPVWDLFVVYVVRPTYTDMSSIISESQTSILVAIHEENETVLMHP